MKPTLLQRAKKSEYDRKYYRNKKEGVFTREQNARAAKATFVFPLQEP